MTHGLGLISLLITVAVTGALFTMQRSSQSQKGAGVSASAVQSQALSTAIAAGFAPVEQFLQLAHAQSGTYAGAELPLGTGVTVVRPTSSSYCLQMPMQGVLVHENGPGGTAGPGPC
jgi:hypothetical protein